MAALTQIPEAEAFILHWGEMGGQWGVNRSVAQVHALLYLSARPLNAEEISAELGLARSNVSTARRPRRPSPSRSTPARPHPPSRHTPRGRVSLGSP